MTDAVIVSIAEGIITNLVPRALEKVGNLWGIKHELEVLRNTVSELRAVLYDAEEQYYRDCQIKDWLDKLKDVFYDIQDLLEELDIEAIRRELRGHNEMIKEVRTFFSNSNQLAFKLKMSYKVRAARERIETIKTDRNFKLAERLVDSQVEIEERKRKEMYSFIHKGGIIEREDDKKRVNDFLLDLEVKEGISILPIVGTGGIGKTTLAHCVYNDEKLSKHFDFKMWVCVSTHFDMREIVKRMIACAKKEEPTEVPMGRLQSELREEIKGKRYLLVLDDLWGVDQTSWQSLKTLLLGSARGSKILITTQVPLVAKITGTTRPYFLKGLSISASLDLLMQVACREMQGNDLLLATGKEIVRKCFRLPLVVRTVGSLLFFKKTLSEWLHFKDYVLLNISQHEDRARSMLRLSYNHLPSHLKQCFGLCSLFPYDYRIKKQTLVNLWVAAGFILPSNRSQHVEDIAHEYFMDLLFRNFLQDFEKDPITKVETCKIHKMMHNLAYVVAADECQRAWDCTISTSGPRHARHVSGDSTDELPASWLTENLVRTFLYVPPYRKMERSEPTSKVEVRQLIRSFKRMRILDLHATIVKKVLRPICTLKHLKYLDLSQNKEIKRLPISITRLHHLQTLNLCSCSSLEELPRGIKKLVSLRNLDLDGCSRLSFLPRGLGQLTSLHTLTRFILPSKKALAKNYCKLRELNGLNNIKGSLSIENLGYITDASAESRAADLIAKHSLKSLILRWGYLDTDDPAIGDEDEALLDGLRPHSNLQKLTINRYNGENFPKWMMDGLVLFLPNLVKVRLLRCGRCKHLPQLGGLPHLKSLEIWMLTELESIESDHSSTALASFPSLLRLKIRHCENLKAMPLAPHIEHLVLKEVDVELINFLHTLNKLKSLDISQMEFLECLPKKWLQSLTSLERLEISECPKLTSLSLGMRHLSNLVHLSFSNCEELDLSKDESDNYLDLKGLESLHFVDILGVPKLASLPQWLLQVDLEQLSIKKCLNLKALPEQIEALQSLRQLEIVQCPLLTSLPEAMRRLMSLNHLRIAGCPKLEERCQKDAGEDWYKIAHIPHITHQLEYYERHL